MAYRPRRPSHGASLPLREPSRSVSPYGVQRPGSFKVDPSTTIAHYEPRKTKAYYVPIRAQGSYRRVQDAIDEIAISHEYEIEMREKEGTKPKSPREKRFYINRTLDGKYELWSGGYSRYGSIGVARANGRITPFRRASIGERSAIEAFNRSRGFRK